MALIPGYQITKTLVNSRRSCVLRATRDSDACPVIIKQLNATPEPGQLSRFSFCYDIICQLSHPNIAKGLEWLDTVGRPTMIMEDIGGVESLAFLNSFPRQQFPLPLFLKLAIEAVDALVAIHRQHIIHKDLHPGNIVVNPQTHRLQIIDFGLATLLSREQPLLEPVDRLEGAIPYIAPEQTGRMNRALDYRADFYTLGATFYHWLVGQPPFGLEKTDNSAQLVHAHVAKIPEPVDSFRHDVPKVLVSIIEKLLQKTAEARYQSAIGLLKDLQRCQRALSQNIDTPEFPLGMDDVSDRLQIPQKLYGRQSEVDLLMAEFFSASKGQARVVAVGGYSGVGKSALVHEIHKPIAAVNGIFVSGKFDQFQSNTPYAALKVAIGNWLKYALTMDESAFRALKDELLATLGDNARVLIDFMAMFSSLLGDLPAVAKLGSDETKTRLHLVIQAFFKEATRHRPLVVFIDDLQWADRGTLDLLPYLLSEQGCRLLVIVAYRDNEVDESHPAMLALSQLEKSPGRSAGLQHINLRPLQVDHIKELLQETLLRTPQDVEPLAELVREKTAGNPFFIGEFLKELYVEDLLQFDHRRYCWQWDHNRIAQQNITDNVVDLMLHKMQRLPHYTQELIQLGSCIGGQFDLEMLALVSGQSLIKVTQQIWPALKQGVLLQDGGDWLLGTQHHCVRAMVYYSPDESLQSQSSPIAPKCRFLHDRMLQAAYQSMSLRVRQHTHLHIAKVLLGEQEIDQLSNDQLFSIVDHLNIASPLIEEANERAQLTALNYKAAVTAKAASVWSAAANYCRCGVVLLGEDGWNTEYQLTRDLYIIKAECEYLSGCQEQAEKDYKLLLQYLPDDLLKAEMLSVRLTQAIGRGEWLKGLDYGTQALNILGYPLPSNAKMSGLYEHELSKLSQFGNCNQILNTITELDQLEDSALRLVLQINANLNISAYLLNQQVLREYLTVSSINLILQNGNSDITAISLSLFSLYLRWQHKYKDAFLAAKLCRKFIDTQTSWGASSCCSTIGLMGWYLNAPIKEALDVHEQGFLIGLENGELARAAINRSNTAFLQLASGMSLHKVMRRTRSTMEYLDKVDVFQTAAGIVNSAATAMVNASPDGYRDLENSNYPNVEKFKNTAHYIVLLMVRTLTCFWFEKFEEGMRNAKEMLSYGDAIQAGASLEFDFALVVGLLAWRNPEMRDPEIEKAVGQFELQLEQVAELYPANFAHKYHLLQAEKGRRLGSAMSEVVSHYQAAINSALEHGFSQYLALANEYFAEYWIESGYQQAAEPYLNEAIYHYHRWGCKIKVRSLRAAYSDWNAEHRTVLFSDVESSEVVPTGTDIRSTLDMASVMKAAQAISKELDLKKVAENILHVIEECAGATATAFIDANHSEPLIIGYSQAATGVVIPNQDMPVAGSGVVPVNVISYVLRTKARVNFGDAFGEKAFIDDPYMIAHQPRSLLCIPVFLGNGQMNILYLENTLTLDAFTEERMDAINLLLAQAVISLSNARLYSEMTNLNVGLERKVKARSKELAKTLKKLELANEDLNSFSYSVSHDLRSPLRSLKGFGKMLIDEYRDEFDPQGVSLLERIVANCNKMTGLIDGLLELSRIQRRELSLVDVDLSAMVVELFAEMKERYPQQKVSVNYQEACIVRADERMLRAAIENLLQNAWKYSRNREVAQIEFGAIGASQRESRLDVALLPLELNDEATIYYIQDNGAGFDLAKAGKLFTAFHRMHTEKQFEGTGIGLSTVHRIIEKHGGKIWAHATLDQGATFYFTIPSTIPYEEVGKYG